ncbi:MAG: LacI family DNA-binding transcriptional regulator [Phycisphaerales bacterium]
MTTLQQIADIAGVSKATVSRVLNGMNKETWPSAARRADEIRQLAQQMNFIPNSSARALSTSRTYQIGVLVRNDARNVRHNPAKFDVLLGINDALESKGYAMTLVRVDDVRHPSSSSRVFRERMLDGMIVVDCLPDDVQTQVEQLVGQCIWVESDHWVPTGCLRRDERAAGKLAVEQAALAGYKRIIYVDPEHVPNAHYSIGERLEGARDAARRLGLPWIMSREYTDRPDRTAFDGLLPHLDADCCVVGYNDMLTLMATRVATDAGLRPGIEFGLICCDDTYPMDMAWMGISRVSFDRFSLGQQAARMMLAVTEDGLPVPPSIRQPVQWIPGTTLRRPRPDGRGDSIHP